MTTQFDPALLTAINALKDFFGDGACLDTSNLDSARAISAAMTEQSIAAAIAQTDVTISDQSFHDDEFAIDVSVQIYKNNSNTESQAAILYIHGGGFILGSANQSTARLSRWCQNLGATIVSVEYRLAPENPFPAGLYDCLAALKWLSNNAQKLNIDAKRIAVVGESAGGGLAAGLGLYVRDFSDIKIAYQLLLYPMLDHTNNTPADTDHPDTIMWSRANNHYAWQAYLGDGVADDMLQYAAASSASNLRNLPATCILVGDQDLFFTENRQFYQQLEQANVDVQLKVYPGGFHCFADVSPQAKLSQQFNSDMDNALRDALYSAL